MPRRLLTSVLLLLAMHPAPAAPPECKVIAHRDFPVESLSVEQIRRIYLLTLTSIEGVSVEPVVTPKLPVHLEFLKLYVGKTESALNTYYWSLVFTGRAFLPRSFDSEADLVAYIARTRGAIGYVSAAAPLTGVRQIAIAETAARHAGH